MKEQLKIKFLGVGASLNENLGNTHFIIEAGKNKLQVDCGGGLKLAQEVKKGKIHFENLFLTHCHTDHFLGFFNLLRTIPKNIKKLNIFCSSFVENNIKKIVPLIMGKKTINLLTDGTLNFINIENLKKQNIHNFEIEPINLNSKKMIQYGFLLKYNGIKILFFGDEAIGILDRDDLEQFIGVDYLICESLNIDSKDLKNGGNIDLEKIAHISSKTAGKIAKKLKVKNLILIHTNEFKNREKLLKQDAKTEFLGNIIIPKDGDIINL